MAQTTRERYVAPLHSSDSSRSSRDTSDTTLPGQRFGCLSRYRHLVTSPPRLWTWATDDQVGDIAPPRTKLTSPPPQEVHLSVVIEILQSIRQSDMSPMLSRIYGAPGGTEALDVLMKYMYVHRLVWVSHKPHRPPTSTAHRAFPHHHAPPSHIQKHRLTKVLAVTKAWHREHHQAPSATSPPNRPASRRFILVAAARVAAKP